MGLETVQKSVTINASPRQCYDALCQFESYPQWQSAVQSVQVLAKYPDGRAKDVEVVVHAVVKKIRYVLRYQYDDARHRLSWTYVDGDVRNAEGWYQFKEMGGDKTEATCQMGVDPGFWVPKMIRNTLTEVTLTKSMEELKIYAEKKG